MYQDYLNYPWPLSIPFLVGRKLQCHLSKWSQGRLHSSFNICNIVGNIVGPRLTLVGPFTKI